MKQPRPKTKAHAAAPPLRPTLAAKGEYDGAEGGLGIGLGLSLERLIEREEPFVYAPGDLPAPECDFSTLGRRLIPPPGEKEEVAFTDFAGRARNLARKMAASDPDTTELEHLHACLVMALRREGVPAEAKALFFRIWDEEGAALATSLPTRWRISAAQCFADHGRSEAERSLGAQIALMFGIVKLYESERRFSGLASWQLFAQRRPQTGPLPMGLAGYDLNRGDLPRNLLARLVRLAPEAGPMGEIALALLSEYERSNRGLLTRLARMRARLFTRQD